MPRPRPEDMVWKMDTWTDCGILAFKLFSAFLPLILMAACFLGGYEGSEKEKAKRAKKNDFHAGG
jgi:hypothetical protein